MRTVGLFIEKQTIDNQDTWILAYYFTYNGNHLVMKTAFTTRTGIVATLVLAGTLGFWLLVYITSKQQQRCNREPSVENISLIKLI